MTATAIEKFNFFEGELNTAVTLSAYKNPPEQVQILYY